jgi:hypothetical protein
MDNILIPVEASFANPGDTAEVSMLVDVSKAGITRKTARGFKMHWTPEMLREKAKSLVGMPVNVALNEDGSRATGHSKNAIGSVTGVEYNEDQETLKAHLVLWKHYFPETVDKLGQLFMQNKLQVSAEYGMNDYDEEEPQDGTPVYKPNDGRYTGIALVDDGADIGNRVLLMASYKKELEATEEKPMDSIILPNSYEWVGNKISEYLATKLTNEDDNAVVVGTYPNAFFFTAKDKQYSVNFEYTGNELTFSDPVEVDPKEEVNLSVFTVKNDSADNHNSGESDMPTEAEIAELEAAKETAETSAAEWEGKFNELKTQVDAKEAADKAAELANTRLAEIDTIAPYTDATLKEEHRQLFASADEKVFDAFKKMVAASAAPSKGIAGGDPIDDGADEDTDPVKAQAKKNLPKWREEALANFPQPETN